MKNRGEKVAKDTKQENSFLAVGILLMLFIAWGNMLTLGSLGFNISYILSFSSVFLLRMNYGIITAKFSQAKND